MPRRPPYLARALGLVLAAVFWRPVPAPAAEIFVAPECKLEQGPVRAVARVLDGETALLDDGSEVRLIGALAPRGYDAGTSDTSWEPAVAAQQALARLIDGRSVALAFDAERTDRYSRWLAQLIVDKDGKEEWVQGSLLALGMARAYGQQGNAACIDQLIARERIARDAGRGLWANAAYYLRAADQAQDLRAYQGTFQLVAGRIDRVFKSRGRIWINLAAGRSSFSASLKRADLHLLGNVDTKQLEGMAVIVRGWIDARPKPLIEVDSPGQIEFLESAGAAQRPPPGAKTTASRGAAAER